MRARTVLFGGQGRLDTWEFDGANWLQVVTSVTPHERVDAGMAYDAALGRVVLASGYSQTANLRDTWLYDGVTWVQVTPPSFGGGFHTAGYDPLRGRVLLSQSYSISNYTSNSEFDGTAWTQVGSVFSFSPQPARDLSAMAFDLARRRAVLFGGWYYDPLNTSRVLDDTWVWPSPAAPSWTAHGAGCAGSAGVPTLAPVGGALPVLGTMFQLQLGNLPSSPGLALLTFGFDIVQWNGVPLPVALGVLGLPACQAWIAPLPDATLLLAYTGSTATTAIPIPAQPALAGVVAATQAFVLDAVAPGGAALTNAGILLLY